MSDFKFVVSKTSLAYYIWNSKTKMGIRISPYTQASTKEIITTNWCIDNVQYFKIRNLTFHDIFDNIDKSSNWLSNSLAVESIKPFFKELVDNL